MSGGITASTGVLSIGGNGSWGEWFAGLIDEVRVYNRALSATDVSADMTTPVTCAGPPALSVTPTSLSFSGTEGAASPAAKPLAIANSGGGSMNWTASKSASWLSLSPGSGTNAGTVTVTPSTTGLAAGTYTTDITVTAAGAGGSPKNVPVTLTVDPPPPVLTLSATSLSFSGTAGTADPADKTFSVSNTGGGTLNWSASESASWLSLSPGSGTNAGTVTVTAAIAGLTFGTYTTDITVSAPGATGSPKTVSVTLTLDPPPTPPVLSSSPASLSFGGQQGGAEPAGRTISVSNTGGGTLSWTASDDAPWLTLAPTTARTTGRSLPRRRSPA